ncbi:MAG: hypothetical protein DRI90_22380 [Deltaproteobacteria bacterium]|nr:MAG: hypothetical protein DRI90_22380 [Deltaproteobacteria bacterium]
MMTRPAALCSGVLSCLALVLGGCDDSNETKAKTETGAEGRQTVGALLIAPGESTPGIEMVVSLPMSHDAKTTLEALIPAVHQSLKACNPGGTVEVAAGDTAMMAVQVEGTKILSADAAKGSGLECAAKQLVKAKLPQALPKKVRLMLLLRPLRPDAGKDSK